MRSFQAARSTALSDMGVAVRRGTPGVLRIRPRRNLTVSDGLESCVEEDMSTAEVAMSSHDVSASVLMLAGAVWLTPLFVVVVVAVVVVVVVIL